MDQKTKIIIGNLKNRMEEDKELFDANIEELKDTFDTNNKYFMDCLKRLEEMK